MAKNILIADDNGLVRKLVRIMLERDEGWTVTEANDGPEAIKKARKLKPDIVILDFAMPIMDGLDTAREIVRMLPSVPILLFTLYDSPETTLAAKAAGVWRVLPKTAAGLPLIRAVEELLAAGPQVSAREVPPRVNEPPTAVATAPPEPNATMMRAEARNTPGTGCNSEASPDGPAGPEIKAD